MNDVKSHLEKVKRDNRELEADLRGLLVADVHSDRDALLTRQSLPQLRLTRKHGCLRLRFQRIKL